MSATGDPAHLVPQPTRPQTWRPRPRLLLAALGAALLFGLLAVVASPVLAAPPPTGHPVEGREACTTCHQAGGGGPISPPANHAGYPDSACLGCHPIGAASQPTVKPATTPAQPGEALPAPTATPRAEPAPAQAMPVTADTCLVCHESPDLSTKLPSGELLNVHVDGQKMAQSVHGGKLQCLDCHATMTTFPHQRSTAKTKREFQVAQYEACKQCHATVYATYLQSVHGRALTTENNADVPLCGDCHGTHQTKDTDSASFRLDSPEMCATCHANAAVMNKYGISPNVFKTYSQDFHGATVMLAQKEYMPHQVKEAVCYDCHGVHDVKSLRTGDPVQVRQAVLAACQKCHPTAGSSFPEAWLGHYELSLETAPLPWIVRIWYFAFIPFMVGGMAIHIGADLYRSRHHR